MAKKTTDQTTMEHDGEYVSPSLLAAYAGKQVTFPIPEDDQLNEQLG